MMSKLDELQAQVEALQNLLAEHGLVPPAQLDETGGADYIEFGSPEHATHLGVIEVEAAGDDEAARDFITFTSPTTGTTYRLEDEITNYMQYPNPEKAARLVLRQKVSSLESGPPRVPLGAPPLWRPVDMQ